MNLIEWYVKNFGISEIDIAESKWLSDWVKRNSNRLNYNPLNFRIYLVD